MHLQVDSYSIHCVTCKKTCSRAPCKCFSLFLPVFNRHTKTWMNDLKNKNKNISVIRKTESLSKKIVLLNAYTYTYVFKFLLLLFHFLIQPHGCDMESDFLSCISFSVHFVFLYFRFRLLSAIIVISIRLLA